MTDSELLAAIDADPQARALAGAGDDAGCAARLAAVLPPAVVPDTRVSERTVMAAFADPAEGEAVLQGFAAAADSDAVFRRVLAWLSPEKGGVDFGNPAARASLDRLGAASPSVFTPARVAALKALAERPAAVSAGDVSRAYLPRRPAGRIA